MPAPKEIADLVSRFEMHYDEYKQPHYKEADVRGEFIDPFFEALGWDVGNRIGADEAYKDVLRESREGSGAPDYAFRYGERIRFYVEAKKPSVNLEESVQSAYQLRDYAWNAKLPLSILTDFEEFAVYNCQYEPKEDDRPDKGRILYMTFRDYLERWDEIDSVFSKRAILQGSFDKYVTATKDKRGTKQVDDRFLEDITKWRELLARNIAIRNTDLGVYEMNASVQGTINRIVFLRICEDRAIEKYGQLLDIAKNGGIYPQLVDLFKRADDRYNSGLFHFTYEPGRAAPDLLALGLKVDDTVLNEIITGLYPPSPYRFNVIPPEILGQVYEQFLGQVIRLTEGHRAKVELKPEVKKAGGIVYTPSFIVNYLVENTVGKWLVGKTPKEVEKLKILDLACGSGAFLLGAYRRLLAWHLGWWSSNLGPKLDAKMPLTSPEITRMLPTQDEPAKSKKAKARMAAVNLPIYKASNGAWKLTLAERRRILLNNVYGVDIDPQAVEVTKLSLLLKVLEDEGTDAVQTLKKWSGERVLPDLSNNIKCGNSLVDTDIELNDIVYGLIKPFHWETEFSEVMAAGGFDIIIGNPPYVRQEILGNIKDYFQTHYKVYQGTADLYSYFIERSHSLLRPGGLFGMIISNKWLRANYGKPLRRWLKELHIEEIIDFGDLPVFENATTYPCILRLTKDTAQASFRVTQVKTLDYTSLSDYVKDNSYEVNQSTLDDEGWSLANDKTHELLTKIKANSVPMSEYVGSKVNYGIKTGLNEAFVIDAETKNRLIAEDQKSAEIIKPFLAGRDIKRYHSPEHKRYLIFTRRGVKIENYPAIKHHLLQYKTRLMPKPEGWRGSKWEGRKPGAYNWYEIQDTVEYHAEFDKPKIMYLVFQVKPAFTFDDAGTYANNAVWIIPKSDKYLLGILNSRLGWFMISNYCTQIQNGYQLIFKYLGKIPIHTIDFSDSDDKARHDRVVSLVDSMLSLHKQLAKARTSHEQTLLQRQIEATDGQIDKLVYELYGLTEEEIKIVEEHQN